MYMAHPYSILAIWYKNIRRIPHIAQLIILNLNNDDYFVKHAIMFSMANVRAYINIRIRGIS